jgi:pyruvate dehydrogenase E2 component (dihydrolipoamide acetyltransferase)
MAHFQTDRDIPNWRRVAASTWQSESDASIHGWLDVDATALGAYLGRRRELGGPRVTLTHLVGKAVATAFAESPECNAYVSFGRLRRRSSVDVFFSVAAGDGKNLSGALVRGADRLALEDIAARLDGAVARIRGAGDSELQRSQALLRRVPSPLLGVVMRASARAMYDLGLDLGWAGVPFDPFGTAIVTNVGVLGIEQGFAPLMPQGRSAAIFTVGKIRDKVLAVDGKPAVRPTLTIGATFDHRVVDGFHLGRISAALTRLLADPERACRSSPARRSPTRRSSSRAASSSSPSIATPRRCASPPRSIRKTAWS